VRELVGVDDRADAADLGASDSESAISACLAGSSTPSVKIGSGSHSPTYCSRRARAERSSLIASRVVMVAT
jgi:hypothetical protein